MSEILPKGARFRITEIIDYKFNMRSVILKSGDKGTIVGKNNHHIDEHGYYCVKYDRYKDLELMISGRYLQILEPTDNNSIRSLRKLI